VVAGQVDGQVGRPRGRGRTTVLELLGLDAPGLAAGGASVIQSIQIDVFCG